MIHYLLISALSMALLLVFYHIVLEHEKIHHFKRGFLLFSLVFSLIIPLMPVGMLSYTISMPWQSAGETVTLNDIHLTELTGADAGAEQINTTASSAEFFGMDQALWWGLFLIYTLVTIGLLIRLMRILHAIDGREKWNRAVPYNEFVIVLMDEPTAPHTFLKTIYVNRDHYTRGLITPEILRHEAAHARQCHSLDILFVEILKILMWFNPALYLYKGAMLINHEFLADQEVLSDGIHVSAYQKLLYSQLRPQPGYGLNNSFNFSITKKRFAMMTKPHSRFRSTLKMMLPLPLFISLALVFGCESTSPGISEKNVSQDEITLEITENNTIKMNGNEQEFEKFEEYFSTLLEPPELVHFKVSPDASMGLITDVQMVLRKKGALRITYKTTRADSGSTGKYDELTSKFIDSANAYMGLPPNDLGQLIETYTGVKQSFDSLKTTLQQTPDAPPPPPMPPSPEVRLNLGTDDLDPPPAPNPPPPPVENRNM